jgi:hypothetical protein
MYEKVYHVPLMAETTEHYIKCSSRED